MVCLGVAFDEACMQRQSTENIVDQFCSIVIEHEQYIKLLLSSDQHLYIKNFASEC